MKKHTKKKAKAPAVSLVDFNSPASLEAFRKASKELTAAVTRTKKTARDFLISEGIYTKSGRLAKAYR